MKLISLLDPKLRKYFTYEDIHGEPDPAIEKFILNQRTLNEGLILSHPIDRAINVIEKAGFECVMYAGDKFKNKFFVEVDGITTDIEKLFKIADNLGWFCAAIRGIKSNGTNDVKYSKMNLFKYIEDYDDVMLTFEPKYDTEIPLFKHPFLYHFTKKIYLKNIKINGLTPRNDEKLSRHPERIYLGLSPDAVEKFGRKIDNRLPFNKKTKTNDFSDRNIPVKHNNPQDVNIGVILRIDTRKISNYFKIYSDPNFYNDGCYTLNTIPYSAITIFKEFELNY